MKILLKRPVWAEINLQAIKNNVLEIRKIVDKKRIMAIIKANAYGHGSVEIAKTLIEEGIDFFGVAILEEALELRRKGFTEDILILGWLPPENYQESLENNIIICIYDFEEAKILEEMGKKLGIKARVHLKIDTGMTRIGFLPSEKSLLEILTIMKYKNIIVEGIFSHFSKADEKDKSYANLQLKKFKGFVEEIEKNSGKTILWKHIANSASILDFPSSHFNMVRAGIILYGLEPSEEVGFKDKNFLPALSLKAKLSRVAEISSKTLVSYGGIFETGKANKIGTIPIGYADGYTRLLTGKGKVLIKGKKKDIIGKICMDQCMVDLSEVTDIKKGDEVILLGGGIAGESADDLAKKIGTINYEIVCMFSDRIPKIYKE